MHMDISREPPSVDIAHKHRNDCSYVSDLSNFLFLLTLETLYLSPRAPDPRDDRLSPDVQITTVNCRA